ncbi:hypothetical protein Q31b_14320 [Novipirellula aureliae]|uniref:Uncharacterized protein n=1 Tax=Novipirellula aureliae TaxID=2527966 RepID=A0A5C6E4X7_9BACT|nr:hypothetical protein [Novipirellula aureliae]TWU43900.1 hypothetical protein Q31b_14320 [Novipirellula aureliae]
MDAAKRNQRFTLSCEPQTVRPALWVFTIATAVCCVSAAKAAGGIELVASDSRKSEVLIEGPVRISPASFPHSLSSINKSHFVVSLNEEAQEELGFDSLPKDPSETDDEEFRDHLKSREQRNLMDQDESQGRQPEVVSGRFILPDLSAATTNTTDIGNGKTPDGFRGDSPAPLEPLPESGVDRPGSWTWSMRTWAAPNTFSYPRYFEDRMLERHGHERCPHWTPLLAGARFFGTVPLLPYLATVQHPCECEYTLGYYRSGNCVPAYLQRPPYERKAVIAEAAAITAGVLIIP